jgi:hypothetical protein
MINTIQNNAYTNNNKNTCSCEAIYNNLFSIIKENTATHFDKKCNSYLNTYCIEKKDFFINFFSFLIKQKINKMQDFLNFYEVILKTNIYSSKFNSYFYKNIKRYI